MGRAESVDAAIAWMRLPRVCRPATDDVDATTAKWDGGRWMRALVDVDKQLQITHERWASQLVLVRQAASLLEQLPA
jgi:hypothetical protein